MAEKYPASEMVLDRFIGAGHNGFVLEVHFRGDDSGRPAKRYALKLSCAPFADMTMKGELAIGRRVRGSPNVAEVYRMYDFKGPRGPDHAHLDRIRDFSVRNLPPGVSAQDVDRILRGRSPEASTVRDDECHGLLMEYVPGLDMMDHLIAIADGRDEPFSEIEICAIARGVFAGLRDMHAAGIAHKDVKPENVRVERGANPQRDPPRAVKIVDLGAACFVCHPAVWAQSGTPEYWSPDRYSFARQFGHVASDFRRIRFGMDAIHGFDDNPRGVSVAAQKDDVWAAAVTMFMVLVGTPLVYPVRDDIRYFMHPLRLSQRIGKGWTEVMRAAQRTGPGGSSIKRDLGELFLGLLNAMHGADRMSAKGVVERIDAICRRFDPSSTARRRLDYTARTNHGGTSPRRGRRCRAGPSRAA